MGRFFYGERGRGYEDGWEGKLRKKKRGKREEISRERGEAEEKHGPAGWEESRGGNFGSEA